MERPAKFSDLYMHSEILDCLTAEVLPLGVTNVDISLVYEDVTEDGNFCFCFQASADIVDDSDDGEVIIRREDYELAYEVIDGKLAQREP